MSDREGPCLRAISQYRDYDGPTAQPLKEMVLATGDRQVVQRDLRADLWRWMDVTEWEREAANTQWPNPKGLTEGEIFAHRLSSFDSYAAQDERGWTNDERKKVEEAIRTGPGNGPDYIVVEQSRVPAPWPAYPKLVTQGRRTIDLVVQKIVETVTELELNPAHVAAFERENLNRPEVLDALNQIGVAAPEEQVIPA